MSRRKERADTLVVHAQIVRAVVVVAGIVISVIAVADVFIPCVLQTKWSHCKLAKQSES